MRVYLMISKTGSAWVLAQRIKDEGHRALVYINESSRREVGNGIVEKHPEQRKLIMEDGSIDFEVLDKVLYPKPDCIIFDMVENGFGTLADHLTKEGYCVIGGCAWADKVEIDRPYGAKVMKMVGINTPATYKFTDYQKAISFVEEKNEPFVYKPSGNKCTTTTYVAQTADDLIGMLEYYSDIKEEFELQEKVDGIEVSSEIWFNGKEIVNANCTMEEKSLFPAGIGPKCGSQGSVVWIESPLKKLFKEGVGKLVPALKKMGYRGPIDLNTIVTKDKLYGLEFTARFGYNALFVLLEMYKGKLSDLMYGIASGVQKEMQFRSEFGIGIALGVPPYPLDVEPDLYKDVLIQGINSSNEKHIWLYDAYKKGDRYLCAGCGGDVGDVTARGDSIGSWSPIRDAKRRVMRTINNLIIPDVMYREDIGDRVQEEYQWLKNNGWL
jgi:phosphoribosylamine--glycine ligase